MSEYTDDIAEMIADLPVTYIIGASTYTGTIGTLDKGNDLTEGGFLDDVDAVLIGKKSDHATPPAIGTKLLFTGGGEFINYRITRITTTPADNAEIRFALQDTTQ
tara:strand:+ start:257 stop:571 length:315 start_codon:yes stop_codon:yes gene_type:complete